MIASYTERSVQPDHLLTMAPHLLLLPAVIPEPDRLHLLYMHSFLRAHASEVPWQVLSNMRNMLFGQMFIYYVSDLLLIIITVAVKYRCNDLHCHCLMLLPESVQRVFIALNPDGSRRHTPAGRNAKLQVTCGFSIQAIVLHALQRVIPV